MSIQMFNKSPATAKVNFLDDHVDNIITENAALRSKLQSKVEALAIMSKQLEKCSIEKDRYKLLTEQFQARYTAPRAPDTKPCYNGTDIVSNISGAQMLANTREQNKVLSMEIETLKHKLEEADEDIRVLRKQNNISQVSADKSFGVNAVDALSFEREELVRQLENLNKKTEQMQADLRSMLDEKEDLVNERDAYKCKLHRLNHQLMVALSKKGKSNGTGLVLDIDALIMENRYLQERLTQAQAEKELATHALTKYKSILETKHRKGSLKLGTNNTNAVVTHKQVKHLLESGTSEELPVTSATIADLRALSFGLLDALNDKSLALTHQKKANRILASRITELEKRLESTSESEEKVSLFPSKVFLETYCSSEVDRFALENNQTTTDVENEENNGKQISEIPEIYQNGHRVHDETVELSGKKEVSKNVKRNSSSSTVDSEGRSRNDDYAEDVDETLSPELQMLVQEALESIYLEENDN